MRVRQVEAFSGRDPERSRIGKDLSHFLLTTYSMLLIPVLLNQRPSPKIPANRQLYDFSRPGEGGTRSNWFAPSGPIETMVRDGVESP